ncbi:hypothetical protein C8R44DRAFT_986987 [Mycena epipterygia]|nr:hypothetical protein C8R44DRAFT_986987 [Mycena epipterygia]
MYHRVTLHHRQNRPNTRLASQRTFGEPIFDESEVEDRIRRAQRAILNSSKTSRDFLDDDDEDLSEVSFSTNFISLQIRGPEVADLSFVDLPHKSRRCLIASVSRGGNDRDIAMVESLVTSYISKPSCVILLTVACETDFENQGARHLTKKYDPEGKHTIGILIKTGNSRFPSSLSTPADFRVLILVRIPRGDEESWLPLIRKTWEQARSILSDLISKRLPEIQVELEKTIQKTRVSLQQLPKPPSSDPVSEIATLLHIFVGKLHKILEGVPRANGLLQVIRPAQERFRRDIRNTAPDFRPFEESLEQLPFYPEFLDPSFLSNEDGDAHGDHNSQEAAQALISKLIRLEEDGSQRRAAIGLNGVSAEDLVKLLPPDRMDPAPTIMSDVRAYFQVTYKRIADNFPMEIDHEFGRRGVGRDMLPTWYSGLGINGADGIRICRELAQESPSVAGKREEGRVAEKIGALGDPSARNEVDTYLAEAWDSRTSIGTQLSFPVLCQECRTRPTIRVFLRSVMCNVPGGARRLGGSMTATSAQLVGSTRRSTIRFINSTNKHCEIRTVEVRATPVESNHPGYGYDFTCA